MKSRLKQFVLSTSLALGVASIVAGSSATADPTAVSTALPDHPRRSEKVPVGEFDIPLDMNKDTAAVIEKSPLYVNIVIPHESRNSFTVCAVYPFPVQPPKPRLNPRPLDTNLVTLKGLIQQTAYTRRNIRVVAYPTGGWRWQESYQAALKRYGQDEPHILSNMIPFVHSMLPYVYEEVKARNEFELARLKRYQDTCADVKETRADAETEATRKGLEGRYLRFSKYFGKGAKQGVIKLPVGEWWIVATQKIPGLTYYWQQPVTMHQGEQSVVTLNEDNALIIEGAW